MSAQAPSRKFMLRYPAMFRTSLKAPATITFNSTKDNAIATDTIAHTAKYFDPVRGTFRGLSPQQHEIRRVFAVQDYHDDEKRSFQFNVGDEISVRYTPQEYLYRPQTLLLGVNLTSETVGIFPSCHVGSLKEKSAVVSWIDSRVKEESSSQHTISDQSEQRDEILAELRGKFQERFGENADPEATLQTVKCLNLAEPIDFWTLFSLVYPQVALEVTAIHQDLRTIENFMYQPTYFRTSAYLSTCSPKEYQWKLGDHSKYGPSWEGLWSDWILSRGPIWETVSKIERNWVLLKAKLAPIIESFTALKDINERMDGVVGLLTSGVLKLEENNEKAMKERAQEVREKERFQRNEYDEQVKSGLWRSESLSSGIDIETGTAKLKNRWKRGKLWSSKTNIEVQDPPIHRVSLYDRTRTRWKQMQQRWSIIWWGFLNKMGETPAVVSIVVVFSIAGLVTTGLATWECSPPDNIPTIDSNFWSTVSSAAIGIASLFCTIIPKLLQQMIKVGDKWYSKLLFDCLLSSSLITALAAVAVYPYQTRASLVLLFISGAAQLATTLQIILGAVTNIRRNVEEIEQQADRIERLEVRLGDR